MYNQQPVTPDLTQYIQDRKRDIKSEINCVALGTIESFNSSDQTVNVMINYLRVIVGGAPQGNNNNETQDKTIKYPILVKCPLMILNGGGAAITFPVAQGDTCILLFCDRDIDQWWETGNVVAPNSQRLHDLNDAIVIVGVKNLQNAIQDYYNGFQIAYAGASIKIDPAGNIIISGTTVSINP